jgi:hypothetical protein
MGGDVTSRLAVAYFGGAVAALIASLVLWALVQIEIVRMLGVELPLELSWSWLGPRLLWGSLFALAYPLPRRMGHGPVKSGLILSLVPSFYELVVVMPRSGHGLLGLSLGLLTPLVVLATNALWGWALARVMIAK